MMLPALGRRVDHGFGDYFIGGRPRVFLASTLATVYHSRIPGRRSSISSDTPPPDGAEHGDILKTASALKLNRSGS